MACGKFFRKTLPKPNFRNIRLAAFRPAAIQRRVKSVDFAEKLRDPVKKKRARQFPDEPSL
jgi:hypothetical protein